MKAMLGNDPKIVCVGAFVIVKITGAEMVLGLKLTSPPYAAVREWDPGASVIEPPGVSVELKLFSGKGHVEELPEI